MGRAINDQPDLDLLYFEPYIPRGTERVLFDFLRSQLPFYRVEYDINRAGVSTHIRSTLFTIPLSAPLPSYAARPLSSTDAVPSLGPGC